MHGRDVHQFTLTPLGWNGQCEGPWSNCRTLAKCVRVRVVISIDDKLCIWSTRVSQQRGHTTGQNGISVHRSHAAARVCRIVVGGGKCMGATDAV